MGYIEHVILEEYQRLKDLSRTYRDRIATLPKGSVSIKKRKENEYLYLANREDGKVKFHYIGSTASENAKEILAQVNARKQYEQKLNQVNRDLKEIGRVLHGRKL